MRKMKMGVYLLIITSFLGAAFLEISISFFHLTLFKVAFLFCALGFIITILQEKKWHWNTNNKFYFEFLFVWMIENIISLLWIKDYRAWMKYTYYIMVFLFFIFYFRSILKTEKDYKKIHKVLMGMIVALNGIGWDEIFTGRLLFSDVDARVMEVALYNRNPVACMGNPNDFALVMLFGFFLVYCYDTKGKKGKWFYRVLQISCVLLIICTDSRSVLVAFACGIVSIGVIEFLHIPQKRKYWLMTGIFLLVMGVLLFENGNLNFDFSLKKLNSEAIRINLILNGVHFLKETFGLGVGGGNFEFWMRNYTVYNTGTAINMHNWWMEIMVCYGILIFVFYIVFYLKIFKIFYQKYRSSVERQTKKKYMGILALIVSFVVGSIGSSSLFSSIHIWCIWALIASYALFVKNIIRNSKKGVE